MDTVAVQSPELVTAAAAGIERHGFHVLPPLLSDHEIDDVVGHLANHPCQDPYRPGLGTFHPAVSAPAQTHVAFHAPEAVVSTPHLFTMANDPLILATLGRVFGCKPTISYLAAWWSLKGHDHGEQAELFHRDVDDWRFLKLFVYLTDVDDAAGPHAFVPGSQSIAKLRQIRRYSDAEVTEAFGDDSITLFRGPRGTAFLEDTFGLHRGTPPKTRNRLILQVVYSLNVLPYGPRRPFDARRAAPDATAGGPLDPYVNRVYLAL